MPASESALDTSYFTSRFSWNPSDERVYAASEFEDSSDNGSVSGSSSCLSNRHDEMVCLRPTYLRFIWESGYFIGVCV